MYFFPPMMSNIVMMKMPKPKPVVRCTKLAPMLSRKMAITTLPIIYYCLILVSLDPITRKSGDEELIYILDFLKMLWNHQIF